MKMDLLLPMNGKRIIHTHRQLPHSCVVAFRLEQRKAEIQQRVGVSRALQCRHVPCLKDPIFLLFVPSLSW